MFPEIASRLRSELHLKVGLTVLLNLWVYLPYHFLQQHHYFRPTEMRASFLDRNIPFSDETVWIYLSVYLLMPLGPYLMRKRLQLVRYAIGIMLIGAVADGVFLIWPTFRSRPPADGTSALYALLTRLDNPFDAFPSLHAAFAIFAALCAGRVFQEMRTRRLWTVAIWLWAVCILMATLTTKQHVLMDIVGGGLLGWGGYLAVFSSWINVGDKSIPPQTATKNKSETKTTAL